MTDVSRETRRARKRKFDEPFDYVVVDGKGRTLESGKGKFGPKDTSLVRISVDRPKRGLYRLEIFPSRTKGQYRVRFRAANRKVLWIAEGYFSKSNAKRFAVRMQSITIAGPPGDRFSPPEIVELAK